jgi:hypothetical protein
MNNEPVAWINRKGKEGEHGYLEWDKDNEAEINIPLYTHPAKTLTIKEIRKIAMECGAYENEKTGILNDDDMCVISFSEAILKKASEK